MQVRAGGYNGNDLRTHLAYFDRSVRCHILDVPGMGLLVKMMAALF
jgi:hypothetical protein